MQEPGQHLSLRRVSTVRLVIGLLHKELLVILLVLDVMLVLGLLKLRVPAQYALSAAGRLIRALLQKMPVLNV